MKALEGLRERMFRWSVGRKLRRHHVPHRTVPWERSRRIGLLFDATRAEHVVRVDRFAERLAAEGKEVEALGYLDRKGDDLRHFHWFDRREVTWYGRPRSASARKFTETPFDILVCAWSGVRRPLEWVATFSRASWRLGPHAERMEPAAEFLIRVREGREHMPTFLDQAEHFLKTIREHETRSEHPAV